MTENEACALTADVVLLGDFDGVLHVLLIERGWEPFKGELALPGGYVDDHEQTEDAARRELAEETGIRIGALTPVGAYAKPGRDPRGRFITFAYVGRMPHRLEPTAGDDAVRAVWMRVDEVMNLGRLAFDHEQIIRDALSVGINGQVMNPATATEIPAAARVGSWVLYRPVYQIASGRSPLVATGIEGTCPESADAQQVADAMLAAYASSTDRADWVVKVFGADDRLRAWADRNGGQR